MQRFFIPLIFFGLALAPLHGVEGFTLVWSDEFDYTGVPNPEKWGYDLGGGGWGNNEKQEYTDRLTNARVEDGMLILTARQESIGRVPAYTSARLVTKEKQSIQYGRVEVMAKIPSETGTWSAIWMLPTDALLSDTYWPNNGEIDIMEHVGYEEDPLFLEKRGVSYLNNIHSTIHTDMRNGMENQGIGGSSYIPDASTEFHLYAMNWYPDRLEFYVDEVNTVTIDKDSVGIPVRNPPDDISPWWPFTQRFHLILNIAIGGNWGGHFNSSYYPDAPYLADGIDHEGIWPQQMLVDYVRMYELDPREDPVCELPGTIDPGDYSEEYGILLDNSPHEFADLVLHGLDAGDHVEYTVVSAAGGTFDLSLYLAGGGAAVNQSMVVRNLTLESDWTIQPAGTDNNAQWQWREAGTIQLKRGINRIRIEFGDVGIQLGAIRVEAAPAGQWKGFSVDEVGVIDTGNWMGLLGTADAPWLYAPRIDSWIYPISMEETVLRTANQWIFFFSPATLKPYDEVYAPFYYSIALNRWYYSAQGATDNLPGWLFVY